MANLIDNLRNLNSKERFFLVGYALDNIEFNLGDEFCEKIGNELNLKIPKNAFSAIDYHIDWVYASLISFATNQNIHFNRNNNIKGHQEDVDFFVAFEVEQDRNIIHLIFIECKGFERWDLTQLKSKLSRLKDIFMDEDISKLMERIKPHLILLSPNRPSKLDDIKRDCPSWMLENDCFQWVSLPIPEIEKKKTVERCDNDKNKKRNCNGECF